MAPRGSPPTRLRQEIFSLGGRHRGDPLAGAHRELNDPHLTKERRELLKAVVRYLEASPSIEPAGERPARLVTVDLRSAVYAVVIMASAVWVMMVLRSTGG